MSTTTRNKIALAFARNRELRVSDVEAMIRAMEKPQAPAVIDVPLSNAGGRMQEAQLQEAGGRGLDAALEDAKRCVEIKSDGRRCEDPRDEGSERCERHTQWFKTAASAMGLPCPDDPVGLQDFLVRTLALVAQGSFPPQKAGAIARLCGMIGKNMWAYQRQMLEARMQEAGRRREESSRESLVVSREGRSVAGLSVEQPCELHDGAGLS